MRKLLLIPILLLSFVFSIPTHAEEAELNNGWYTISTASLYRIGVTSTKDNATIQLANNKSGQKFWLTRLDDGYYKIATGTTIGISVLTSDENIRQEKYNGSDNQKWIIEKDGAFYTIKNKESELYLTRDKFSLYESENPTKFSIMPFTEKFTVTFKDDGKTVARKSVTKNKSVEYSLPNKDGIVFDGWDADLSNITGNITVNAIWRGTVTHKVVFIYDGEIISNTYVENGKKAEAPEIPIKEGMSFVGWDTECDNVNSDLTINAVLEHEHVWETVHHDAVTHQETYTVKEPYTYTEKEPYTYTVKEPYTYTAVENKVRIYNAFDTEGFYVDGKYYEPYATIYMADTWAEANAKVDELRGCKTDPSHPYYDAGCLGTQSYQVYVTKTGYEEVTKTGYKDVTKTGYKDVQKTRTVTDKAAYDEVVCSVCGAHK